MKIRLVLLVCIIMLALPACQPAPTSAPRAIGSGEIVGSGISGEIEQPLNGVTAVRMEIFGDVQIVIGEQDLIQIYGEENLLPYLDLREDKGTLTVGTQQGVKLKQNKPIQFVITLRQLNQIDVPGNAVVEVSGPFKANSLDLIMSGAGEINLLECDLESLTVQIPGSGSVTTNGKALRQDIKISGSGSFGGENLQGETAVVALSGSGDSVINAADSLLVTISGSGSVQYLGSPSIDKKITGSGVLLAYP